jgi:cell division protein FtsL
MKIFLYSILISSVFLSAIGVIVNQHKARKLFVEVQVLESEQDKLNEVWGKLQLEQSTWSTNDRVEKISRDELQMREPENHSVVFLTQ